MSIIGIIGGSGLYELQGFEITDEIEISTPFGKPSDKLIKGKLFDKNLVFLPRHGKSHRIPPSDVNFRANIYALKSLGVTRIISVSAVGSMKEEIKPGDMVVVRQFIDRTSGRASTFFTDDIVAHISFAEPVCNELADILYKASKNITERTHDNATYICINGPQFSTKAESFLYRSWNVDIIGMTNLPEAKLAREAEICYATLALATDYDCWREEEVTAVDVVKILMQNVENAKKIIREIVKLIPDNRTCACKDALKYALMTDRNVITKDKLNSLGLLIGKYIG